MVDKQFLLEQKNSSLMGMLLNILGMILSGLFIFNFGEFRFFVFVASLFMFFSLLLFMLESDIYIRTKEQLQELDDNEKK